VTEQQLPAIRAELAEFVHRLARDAERDDLDWENPTLARYLEAMSGWIEDLDGYFRNRGERVPDQPTWQLVAARLSAAPVYE
jgi:hypothetical protein